MIKGSIIQIFDFLKKDPAPMRDKDYANNTIIWGTRDDEPLRIINTINGSITGRACLNTINRYIRGMGLSVDFEIEPGYTIQRLHRELSSQIARLKGVAIHVKYNPDLSIASLKKASFENFRLALPDENGEITKVIYNPYWGTSDFNNDYTKIYDLYDNRPEVIRQQIKKAGGASKWNGQIYYDSLTSEFNEFYPLPDWWSNNKEKGGGRKWMEIEQLVSDFHEHNVRRGFLQQALLKVVGDPDQCIPEDEPKKAENKSYRTVGKEFSNHLKEKFAGVDAEKMLIMWAENKEEFPDLTAFPTQSSNHELFLALQKLCTENICIATQVPPVLIGVKVSGTLSKDDIENAVNLMWSSVDSDQIFLEEIYAKLFPLLKGWKQGDVATIMNYSPVSIVLDDKIWGAMTPDEQRKWITDNTDIELDAKQSTNNN